MLNLYHDLQRGTLVCGTDNPAIFQLPTFYAGETVGVTDYALQPTGPRSGLYNTLTITGLILSLNYQVAGVETNLCNTNVFATSGTGVAGLISIPSSVTVPAGQAFAPCSLAADITTADGVTTHIESPALLANPSFPITSPGGLTQYEPALGDPAQSGYLLSSTTAGARSWVAAPVAGVASVNGHTGAVTLGASDVGADPTGAAAAAQSAAETFSANANNLSSGTVALARLPASNFTGVYYASPGVPGGVPATAAQISALVTGAINPSSIGATTPGTGAFTEVTVSDAVRAINFTSAAGLFTVVGGGSAGINLGANVLNPFSGFPDFFSSASPGGAAYFTTLSSAGNASIGGSLAVSGAFSSDGGSILSDGGGNLLVGFLNAGSGINSDGDVNIYGDLNSTGPGYLAGGAINWDTDGNFGTNGALYVLGAMGVFGASGPTTQPATPTTLAGVISILQAYGLCQ